LNHLICGGQQRFRDGEAEGLGDLQVDGKFEFGWLLTGRSAGFSPLRMPAAICSCAAFSTRSGNGPAFADMLVMVTAIAAMDLKIRVLMANPLQYEIATSTAAALYDAKRAL
jgi:hypothetical protein